MTKEGNTNSEDRSRSSSAQLDDSKDGVERTLSPPADQPFRRNRRESKAVNSVGSLGGFIADSIRGVSDVSINSFIFL